MSWRSHAVIPIGLLCLFLQGCSPAPDPLQSSEELLDRPGRIVHGVAASAGEFPWQAGLQFNSWGLTFCGGAFIDKAGNLAANDNIPERAYVLTAGHCAKGKVASGIRVIGGSVNPHQNLKYDVEKIITFGYNPTSKVNDIALLRVKIQPTSRKTAESSRSTGLLIQTIPMAEKGMDVSEELGTVSGFGYLKYQGSQANELRDVQVKIHSGAECSELYTGITTVFNSTVMLCAGGGEEDACQGDSGGPLVAKDNRGAFKLVGVVSWGIGCATPKVPGAYAKISYYHQAIAKQIELDRLQNRITEH